MGLKDGAKMLHSITGLTIEDVFKMCKGLADEYGMDTPTIDVDCSNVCFKVGKTVPSVTSLLIKWANGSHVYTDAVNSQEIMKQIVQLERNCKSAETASANVISEYLVGNVGNMSGHVSATPTL